MIVNVVRRTDGSPVLERIDGDLQFMGGAAQEGVLATFDLDGREVTGRVVRVLDPEDGAADAESVIEIELIDEADQDLESEVTRANLPPRNEAKIKR
ncbi:MAG TPA: hypothetical protein VM782_11265 [Stellaceae bacterium]|nr:hypothetical protein [Stellaceae bacterium]